MNLVIVKNNVRWSYINNPDYHVIKDCYGYYGHEQIVFSGDWTECFNYTLTH
jgi:hypothetical protein